MTSLTQTTKTTDQSYCQSCHKDFADGQTVIWAKWDGDIICLDCYRKSTIQEVEPRVYTLGETKEEVK